MQHEEVTRIWELYEQGKDHHERKNMYTRAQRCHKFYEGDQWDGIDAGIDRSQLPMENIITGIVKYKVSSVAMNAMTINYTPHTGAENEISQALNEYAGKMMELQKMDTRLWDVTKAAAIEGDSYLYFYNRNLDNQVLDATAVYLGDEQQPDLQKQPYIIIYERRSVRDVREDAKRHGVKKAQLDQILPDDDLETTVGDKEEVKSENGKCSCLLYLTKKDGVIHFARCTKLVEYQPLTAIPGLTVYPIANIIWERAHNSARGIGEVWNLIPNQININKNLFRRTEAVKMASFPKMAYVADMIENPENITEAGSPIKIVEGNATKVNDIVAYLQPAPISADATNLQNELIDRTRDLVSAGDAAMGNINPEQASGAAIAAVRDAQAIPLNEQQNAVKQFVEDVARIWLEMLCAYSPNGIKVGDGVIMPEEIQEAKMEIRIDISPKNPWSKMAAEQALAAHRQAGDITFEEYVEALDEDSNVPKGKLKRIIEARAQQPEGMMPQGVTYEQAPEEVVPSGLLQM